MNESKEEKIISEFLQLEKEELLFGAWKLPVDTFSTWMNADDQLNGIWIEDNRFDAEAITDSYIMWGETLRKFVTDTRELINKAIKAGDKLSQDEMRLLVDQLFLTSQPYICPHGRPIIIKIPLLELDKRFGRT